MNNTEFLSKVNEIVSKFELESVINVSCQIGYRNVVLFDKKDLAKLGEYKTFKFPGSIGRFKVVNKIEFEDVEFVQYEEETV